MTDHIALATVTTDLPFETAVARTREALAEQGFGILTEIDVQATMKAKLDVDRPPYLILGACNPPLAHQALSADPEVGLLLPCNVVVRTEGEKTVIQAMDPQIIRKLSDQAEVCEVADEATRRLTTALEKVRAGA
jgi:uncharacterized protein (DUF302 family)